ncbi:DNA mismatch repair protein [Capnocytophaga cynodegmi]|uniref:MutS-related protein n=1 Tax=Capnocytophaga cynodegmi TaxID=28189 RepID=UPI00385DCBA8
MISIYKEKLQEAIIKYKKLTKKYNFISFLRLVVAVSAIVLIYFCFQNFDVKSVLSAIFSVVLFLFLVIWHKKVSFSRKLEKSKIEINTDEIRFLENNEYFSDNGIDFQEESHSYAYDLDIFGEKSVFHHINRAKTFLGKKYLASYFLNPELNNIVENQQSISELSEKVDWRQHFSALTSQVNDSADFYENIKSWTQKKQTSFPKWIQIFAFISPLLLITCVILGFVSETFSFHNWAKLLFLINLVIFGYIFGVIQRNKISFEGAYKILYSYKKSIVFIENSNFESGKLTEIQQKILQNKEKASVLIQKLSNLLDDLDNLGNVLVSIPLNCFTFYHFHTYCRLIRWKNQYASQIQDWLDVVGEMEAFISFANFKYNNPKYVFPEINSDYQIYFEEVGHPLIAEKQRVTNSVSFTENSFVILTGSNMSGKSTFLRTLGVNMLLTAVGLPVCAKRAVVHPMNILVSMRLSDSLNDGKSYFFAEIRRIQTIIQKLENQICFVLLDELLRGTNSEDKQLGTIKIIEKIISLKAFGVVATHDIEVCQLAEKYPQIIQNKCFEVEIENDELHFDYKIRDGVCQNKNATFLMKKIGIID